MFFIHNKVNNRMFEGIWVLCAFKHYLCRTNVFVYFIKKLSKSHLGISRGVFIKLKLTFVYFFCYTTQNALFFCLGVKRSQYSRNESLKKITGIVRLSHTIIMMEKGAIVKVYMKKAPKTLS